MKKLFILFFACIGTATISFAQITNAFPTTGNVGIGTNAPTATGGNLQITRSLTSYANMPLLSLNEALTNPTNTNTNLKLIDLNSSRLSSGTSITSRFSVSSSFTKALELGGSASSNGGGTGYSLTLGDYGVNLGAGTSSTNFQLGRVIKSGSILNETRGLYFQEAMNLGSNSSISLVSNNIKRMAVETDGSLKAYNSTGVETFNLSNAGALKVSNDLQTAGRLFQNGSEINIDHNPVTGFSRRPFMSRNFDATDIGNRWLLLNPRSATANDFNQGTIINSTLVVSKSIAWWDKPTVINSAILAQFDGPVFAKSMYVSGNIYSSGELNLTPQSNWVWADYVFAKDYKLKELNEVEEYIAENKHLPGIPSAADIEKNGLSVGKMQALHMEKIEELTLYMIELQKQNELLQVQNAKMLKRVETLENKQ